jgi:starch-binding outer membrane protein, SusD/RagB family
MKKNIFKSAIALFSSTLILYYSCNKSDLDLLPHGPTEQSYFTQESDFTKAVLGVYAKMSDLYWYNGGANSTSMPIFLLPGDDITTNASTEEFEQFGPLQPSSGRVSYFYATWYQVIARANVVLQKTATVASGIYTTPNLKDYHKGEALFLRGYAYYNLWIYFGTSPLDTVRVTKSDQFKPSGTTGTQLLDQAIKDFTAAASLLPATWDNSNRGRATANSANGFLGKALVFRASATKNSADYTAALSAFNKITGASLVAKFDDNFSFDTENNNESLFEYQATQPFGFDNVWLSNDFDNPIGSLSVFWGYYSNSFALFGQSPFFATTKLLNAFIVGSDSSDPRLALTLSPADRSITKYVTRDQLTQSGVSSANNFRLLRYADVLLLQAEAILQSGGSTTASVNLINQVRTRARNMSNSVQPANYSIAETDKTKIMGWIMNERFLELGGEGQRWPDLKRWYLQGIITLDNNFFSSNTATMSFQAPKHLNLPIPNSERDVNPNVKQNTGY